MPLSVAGEQQFGNMVRQMGKMMDQLQKGYFNYCPAETWTPAVNLYENDIGYIVCVDLSGVEKEKIGLVVADGQLKLRGQRAVPVSPDGGEAKEKGLRVHLLEIDYGQFYREVRLLNGVDEESIRATEVRGMLRLGLRNK